MKKKKHRASENGFAEITIIEADSREEAIVKTEEFKVLNKRPTVVKGSNLPTMNRSTSKE